MGIPPQSDPNQSRAFEVPSDPALAAPPSTAARPLRFASTQASVLLDLVRGFAAVIVLLEHWRNLFFVDYPQLSAHRHLLALPYLLVSAGHQSVVIFFVLSGYLISGSVFRMLRQGAWSWQTYLLHRLTRLWVVLLPCLLMTALWDSIGLHLTRAPAVALYAGLSGDHIMPDIHPTFHLWIWLANLFFLQTTWAPLFGSNGALWSLANEFWYYILFPLGLLALRRRTPTPLRVLYALLFIALALSLRRELILLFPVWLLGTALALMPVPRLSLRSRLAATAIYLPVVFLASKLHLLSEAPSDLIFGLLTVAYLWILLSATGPARERSSATRATRTLARFSYTLYLAHMPILVLAAGLFLGATRWLPSVRHLVLGGLILIACVAYSYALAAITEFRTDDIRKFIEHRIASVPPGPGAKI